MNIFVTGGTGMTGAHLMLKLVEKGYNLTALKREESNIGEIIIAYKSIFGVMLFAMVIHWLSSDFKQRYRQAFINLPDWGKAIVVSLVVFVLWQVRTADLQAFIYFQF